MKLLKYILPLLVILTFTSCSDDDDNMESINEVVALMLVQEFTNETHIVELYTQSGNFTQGYNNITLRIRDKVSNQFIQNASITWTPMMHMTSRMHSCPNSDVIKVTERETIYTGYIIFQMPENSNEGWDLTINYMVDNLEYAVISDISVPMSERQVVSVFMGADDVKYILALVGPESPEVAVNDMIVGLYKMESMMSFPLVEDFMIKLDPRMPSMSSHTSPNNEDLFYNDVSEMYNGKLSLTMTGYWKLNLMLYNANNELLKGEEVSGTIESSSLYLELEF